MKLKSNPFFRSFSPAPLAISVVFSAAGLGIYSAQADTTWTGATNQDWNTASNWTNGIPDDTVDNLAAFINTGITNFPIFSSGTGHTDFDVFVGSGAGATGRVDQNAGTLQVGNGSWLFVGQEGGTGTYNLTGSGSLSAGSINVGAWGASGANGTFNMNTSGTFDATAGAGHPFEFGDASILVGENGSSGTFNLQNGSVNASFGATFGAGTNSAGTLNVSGGGLNVTGILEFGRGGGTGNGSVTGGTISATGEFWVGRDSASTLTQSNGTVSSGSYFVVGRGGASVATCNLSGGTINAATTTGLTAIASTAGASGTLAVSGTGTFNSNNGILVGEAFFAGTGTGTGILTVSGTGLVATGASAVTLGVNASAAGTVNLDGGAIQTGKITKGTGAGTFNFNGGTLKATFTTVDFMGNLTRANVRNGGAKIDTDGFDVTIAQALEHSDAGGDAATDGGITKQGAGTLTLSGTGTYTGNTTVSTGTLSLGVASLNDASTVSVAAGAVLDLSHGATDDVAVLKFNGVSQTLGGTFNAGNSGGFITGTGSIHVVGGVSGYAAYASSHGLSAQPSDDTDADGVKNGTEYFMNSANGFTANPPVVTTGSVRTVTWPNGGNIPATAYGTGAGKQFVVQTSADLVSWASVLDTDPNLGNSGSGVSYTLTGVGESFARLVVTPN